ncbi:triose-phosphate isomerase [Candidatus Pacearchaeota archaeon]|nr:triose-phosphate isomerase [Candidatus Pacearchaeota archaeon]
MIVINFKNYVFGAKAIDLVRKIDIYLNKSVVAVSLIDLVDIVKNTTLPVYAQHIDAQEEGRATGFVIPEIVAASGAKGTLLNHSEHPLKITEIKKALDRCHDAGLKVILCASTLAQAKKFVALKPHALAFEDPALISTGKSITSHKAHALKEFVDLVKGSEVIPLCGAGISNAEDVKEALALGCMGVLVSSAVAHSNDPEKFLKEVSRIV